MNQVGSKPGLRKVLRQQRNALDPARQKQAAIDLKEQLETLPVVKQSKSIALYLAIDGEIDPGCAMDWCIDQGKRCYVPIIMQNEKNSLRFAEITAQSKYENNYFGIAEPVVPDDELINARELDLVLLPLVGFDRYGNRIGMGGGFYDTTFEFKKSSPGTPPQLVGLAHEIQRVEKIQAENWDIPISAVVTDRRVYHCNQSETPW